jgi:hypothetical protein
VVEKAWKSVSGNKIPLAAAGLIIIYSPKAMKFSYIL